MGERTTETGSTAKWKGLVSSSSQMARYIKVDIRIIKNTGSEFSIGLTAKSIVVYGKTGSKMEKANYLRMADYELVYLKTVSQ